MRRWPPLMERLAANIEIAEDGCWNWTGTINAAGYGHVYAFGKVRRAHRVIYELFVETIPEGLELDHTCRNRACVNPDHLEPVTRSENNRRGLLGAGQNAQAAKTHCRRGHPYDDANTYRWRNSRRRLRVCRACHREAQARYTAKRGQ